MGKIRRKLKELVSPGSGVGPSFVEITTYREQGNQWYLPALVGPSTFLPKVIGSNIVFDVLSVLNDLSRDLYQDFVINYYNAGLERFGSHWIYADINTVLLGLSKALKPKSYLEIGVRRGRSMAMVASQSPDCHIVGFDLWITNYAGMDNPGKEFVKSELTRVGFRGEAEFVDGDSKLTVPRYFEKYPDVCFDLITVDGDHSLEGARRDLLNVIPRLKVGGALVFDDISNQDHIHLGRLWEDIIGRNDQFASYSFSEVGFGVGFAIKKHQ